MYGNIKNKFRIFFTLEHAGWRQEYILVLQIDFLVVKGDYGISLLIII